MSLTISPVTDFTYNPNGTPAVKISGSIKGVNGKEKALNITATKELMTVAIHPEIREGGFTKMEPDWLGKFYDGIGSYCMPGSKAEKAAIERNKLRIFDTAAMEKTAREQSKNLTETLKSIHYDFGIPKEEIRKTIYKVVEMLHIV